MLTMSRAPTDSFLPSGAFLDPNDPQLASYPAQLSPHAVASTISPLSLSQAVSQSSYFDASSHSQLASATRSPPTSVPAPAAQSAQRYLSPRQSPPSIDQSVGRFQPAQQTVSGTASPSAPHTSNPGSASPTSSDQLHHQSAALQLRRVTLQNRRLLENWEAERTHLEANRARAEEVYREERAIMDEERMLWLEEKSALDQERRRWQTRAETAEVARDALAKEKEALTELVKSLRNSSAQRGKGLDGAVDSVMGSESGDSSSPKIDSAFDLKLDNLSEGIFPLSVQRLPGRGVTMPESKPFIPLDPRMQGRSPGASSPAEMPGQIPSIDIHEVIPALEGIRIKKPAVDKPTFRDGDGSSHNSKESSTSASQQDSPSGRVKLPAEVTKQTLDAPVAQRLTMHAGHTPNHSISLSRFETAPSTGATNTAGSSGAATPTQEQEHHEPACDVVLGDMVEQEEEAKPTATDRLGIETDDPQPLFEPSDGDKPLEGPLQLRNRPAADEPFLRRLSDKLESSLKSNDTTPTVLLGSDDEDQSVPPAQLGGESADNSCNNVKDDPEIPLKIRNTSNFGVPMGELGSFAL